LGRVVERWGEGILPAVRRKRADRGGVAEIGESRGRLGVRDWGEGMWLTCGLQC
jgi:hypothetical protein